MKGSRGRQASADMREMLYKVSVPKQLRPENNYGLILNLPPILQYLYGRFKRQTASAKHARNVL